jgi:hypothetical protein
MYIVLGHDRMRKLFDDTTVESWFSAYIDLLQRFQLLSNAIEVLIYLSPIFIFCP